MECTGVLDQRTLRIQTHVRRCLDPEYARKLEDVLKDLQADMAELSKIAGGEWRVPVPGRTPCVAKCAGGRAFLNKFLPCKACGEKGSLACSPCKGKGETACPRCAGRRRLATACPECAGSGQARAATSLEILDARACTWCGGAEIRDCKACDENGLRESICLRCSGTGEQVCGNCRGTLRGGCNKCAATRDLSSYLAAKKSNVCDQCDKKGTIECLECDDGRVACKHCAGVGHGKLTCSVCLGGKERKAPCAGCWESAQSWLVAADRLLADGRTTAAIAFLEAAMSREEAFGKQQVEAAKDATEERELSRALAKRQAELRARIEAAKTP